jgi:hypothetical protein
MSPLRTTVLAAALAAVVLVPTAASARGVHGSGTVRQLDAGTCERMPAPQPLLREDCTGVRETLAGVLRSTAPATVTQRSWFDVPSGRSWFSGTERFVGCIDTSCGTLTLTFRGSFVADLSTSTLRGSRTLVVSGAGGGLTGVRGTVVHRIGEGAGYVANLRVPGR